MIITHTEKWPTLYTTTHRAGIRLTFWMYEDATIFLKRKYDKCRSGYVLRRA
jgi:hypothetical protein